MKLYCVKILSDTTIIDIQHIIAVDNKEVHERMDRFLEEYKEYKIEGDGYSFSEIHEVEEFNIKVC